jgi:hypothetical protein
MDVAAFAVPALERAVGVVVLVVPHVGGEGAVWSVLRWQAAVGSASVEQIEWTMRLSRVVRYGGLL